ncbi:MAG: CRISPR-associated endonuclease Cas2 [Thermotoga sp.]|nr:MAG: CRISPR-associated endonuclease Cas2 [Thermotoga sp.]
MNVIIIYDITDDKLRRQISEELKNFGLERIGYSAFCGSISKKALRALEQRLNILIESDVLHIVPLCKFCFQKIRLLGRADLPENFEDFVL